MPPTPEEIREEKVHQAQALIKSTLEKVMDDVTEATDHDIAFQALRAVLIEADVIDEDHEYDPDEDVLATLIPEPNKQLDEIELNASEDLIHRVFHRCLDEGMGTQEALDYTIDLYPDNSQINCRPRFWLYMAKLV